MALHPVILCGGVGTRLWPASSAARPKQFAALVGERSMFQETVLRMTALGGDAPIIVAGAAHLALIREQLGQIGVPARILLEPEGRDSAPAVAVAAALIAAEDPGGLAMAVASDHYLPDASAFADAVRGSTGAAQSGAIVTFGVEPTSPSSAYGYIRRGRPLGGGVYAVVAFIEKPSPARAHAYLAEGYLWNSSNLLFAAATVMSELDRFAPELTAAVRAALAESAVEGDAIRLGPSFRRAPKISIDYALMERTRRAVVAPVDYAWSDLGAWDAVLAASPHDAQGNSAPPHAILVDSQDVLVRAPTGTQVAVVGLKNVAVIIENGAVLVCELSHSQSVKGVAERAAADPAD